jgi:hypothetical protein
MGVMGEKTGKTGIGEKKGTGMGKGWGNLW